MEALEKAATAAKSLEGRISRIAAILLWLTAALGLVGAIGFPISHLLDEEAKAQALSAGPPPRIAIEAFDPGRHQGAFREVAVTGQAVPAQILTAPGPHTRWMLPLLSTQAKGPDAPPIAWLVHDAEPWSATTLQDAVQGRGEAGFILEIGGVVRDPKLHFQAIEATRGAFDDGVVLIKPFLIPREAALAPAPFSWIGWGVFAAAVIGVFFYGLVLWRKGRRAP